MFEESEFAAQLASNEIMCRYVELCINFVICKEFWTCNISRRFI